MQPRKKKAFDKKSGITFTVAPRSLQDPVLHEEGGSKHVLVPKQVKEKRYDADGRTIVSTVAGSVRRGGSVLDEVDEWVREPLSEQFRMYCLWLTVRACLFPFLQGRPTNGYDYRQHYRDIRPGGTFVTPKGDVVSTDSVTASMATELGLPSEALPSDKMMDRMLEAIVVREGIGPTVCVCRNQFITVRIVTCRPIARRNPCCS